MSNRSEHEGQATGRKSASSPAVVWSVVATKTYDEERAVLTNQDARKANKLAELESAIAADPKAGIGKPKPLAGGGPLEGYWSRRIDKKNRLLYAIDADLNTVTLVKCLGHYDDK